MTVMVAISSFVNRVRPDVRGCPSFALTSYTLDAAIEFCDRSRYWREDLAAINAVAAQAAYTAAPPSSESVITDVVSVRHNNLVVNPSSEAELDGRYADWRSETSSQADYWYAKARDNVSLVPYPSAAGTGNINIKAVLKPSQTATTLAQPLYDNYLEAIAAGAKSLLMAIPGMPWSNPERSAYYRAMFEDGIGDAKEASARGFNRAPLRVRPPPF